MELLIQSLSKQYNRQHWGLKNISLQLGVGVLGLLGPNGAGKTTLMNILTTITKPTSGQVLWNGMDVTKRPDDLRRVLGYLPQDFGIYPNLTAIEFLEYMAAMKGLDRRITRRRIDEILQVVNLTHAAKRPLGGYSGGMRQRVGIAQALLNDPQLLIVDEPTVGLDPEERGRFRQLIADLAADRIIILSTHIVSDVEATATAIALINEGQLLLHRSPEFMLQTVIGKVWEWLIPSHELPALQRTHLVSGTIRRGEGVQVRIIASGLPAGAAKKVSPTLEDAYLYLRHELLQAPPHTQTTLTPLPVNTRPVRSIS